VKRESIKEKEGFVCIDTCLNAGWSLTGWRGGEGHSPEPC